MKPVNCPRCHGTGKVDERETLVGIAPILDRPSTVNDDDWGDLDEPSEKTRLAEVPLFTVPPRLKNATSDPPRREEEPPPPPPISAKSQLQAPPSSARAPLWFTVLFMLTLGMTLGAFAMAHKSAINAWVSSALGR